MVFTETIASHLIFGKVSTTVAVSPKFKLFPTSPLLRETVESQEASKSHFSWQRFFQKTF